MTKSMMTYIHLILGSQPERNHIFNSLEELYDKIDTMLEPYDTTQETSYHRKELLLTFDKNIEWMKARKIIIPHVDDDDDKESGTIRIKVDKKKLVKYIIDPDAPLIETNDDSDRKGIV